VAHEIKKVVARALDAGHEPHGDHFGRSGVLLAREVREVGAGEIVRDGRLVDVFLAALLRCRGCDECRGEEAHGRGVFWGVVMQGQPNLGPAAF